VRVCAQGLSSHFPLPTLVLAGGQGLLNCPVLSHVKWVPCRHGMARSQVEDGGEGLEIRRAKVKLSRYMPWRLMGEEEVWLLLILNLGTRWGEWSDMEGNCEYIEQTIAASRQGVSSWLGVGWGDNNSPP
jgi:hypothetical protein